MAPIKLSKENKWSVDPVAIKRARKILGIRHGVSVRCRTDEGGWVGDYDYSPLHTIAYTSIVKRHEVSQVLWHELAHAMQCERDYNGDGPLFLWDTAPLYNALLDDDGNPSVLRDQPGFPEWEMRYYAIPTEAEAEDIADRYAEKYPLVSK